MGDLSAHFDRSEFAQPDGQLGQEPPCRLLCVLEAIRAFAGRPLPIISGWRSKEHNAAVGGADSSRHLTGEAADIPPGFVGLEDARRCGAGGVGLDQDGWATHVDVGPERTWWY